MRVELDETGTLVISSDSPLESFALSHWHKLWEKRGSTFLLQTIAKSGLTHEAIAPEYRLFVERDAALDEGQKERRSRTLDAWAARLTEAERSLGEGGDR